VRTPEENRAHVKQWREANPERAAQLKRESAARNKAHMAEYHRGYYLKNKEKKLAVSSAWYRQNKDRAKDRDMHRMYGVGKAWYDALLEKQNGVCAICGKAPITNRLAIDHNHTTGKSRGLLCLPCNGLLNRVESIPGWATKAEAYLAEHEGRDAS
jgi:hypothetical protein